MSRADQAELLSRLRQTYIPPVKETGRAVAFAVSRELSKRGMAPRWQFEDLEDDQPLDELASRRDKEYRDEIKESRTNKRNDKIVFDLLWLTITYTNHITENSNWQSLFECGDDWKQWLNVAESIDKRVAIRSKKVKGLRLSEEQLFGCRLLCGKKHNKSLLRYEARFPETLRKVKASTSHIKSQIAQLDLNSRVRYWIAGSLTGWSPSNGARVYKMMTGINVSRQATAKAFKKVEKIK